MRLSSKNKTNYSDIKAKDNMTVSTDAVEVPSERKKLDPLVDVAPKKRKRGLVGRLVTGVLGPEGLPGIGAYVSEEIIIPAIKNIIVDAVTSGINMVMYPDGKRNPYVGGGRNYNRTNVYSPRPITNYTSRYTSHNPDPVRPDRVVKGPRHMVEEYIIEDRAVAANVLTTITEHADMYGSVSVADYYDLIDVPSVYTDNNYGWTFESLSRAVIRPVRGGYVINLPQPEVL